MLKEVKSLLSVESMHTEYTSAELIMSTTVCSQAQMVTYVLVAQELTAQALHSSCPRRKESILGSSMSSPHLLTHQHEAPPGQHDLLQEHSTHRAQLLHHDILRESQAHRAHLQTFTRSERIATGPLCDREIQSVRTLRTTHSTGYEPKSLATDLFEPNELATQEFMTTSRSSLEDI